MFGSLCSPIGRCTVVLMSSRLPVSIHPRIVAKCGSIFQLGFGDSSSITLQGGVVFERRPRNWIVAVRQAKKSAEAHDSVCHAARNLFYEEVINLTDSLISNAIHVCPLHVFARN